MWRNFRFKSPNFLKLLSNWFGKFNSKFHSNFPRRVLSFFNYFSPSVTVVPAVQIEDKLSSSIQLPSWHLRVKAATSHYQNYLTKTVFHWIAKNLIKSHINRRNKLWVIWQFDEVDTETQCLTFNIAQFCMGVNLINLPHKKSTLTQEYSQLIDFYK